MVGEEEGMKGRERKGEMRIGDDEKIPQNKES